MWHSPQTESFLPARGHSLVTITVLDENGFTHHYAPIEARRDILAQALSLLSPSGGRTERPNGRSRATS